LFWNQSDLIEVKRIAGKGREITINYNGDPDDPGPVGFDVR
jgi:hypothetical protein